MIQLAKISLLALSIVMTFGGIVGFLKAKSKVSLIAGLIGGAFLICSYSVSMRNAQTGILLGEIIASLLSVMFAVRLFKTRKIMPSGMLFFICLLELIFLISTSFMPNGQ